MGGLENGEGEEYHPWYAETDRRLHTDEESIQKIFGLVERLELKTGGLNQRLQIIESQPENASMHSQQQQLQDLEQRLEQRMDEKVEKMRGEILQIVMHTFELERPRNHEQFQQLMANIMEQCKKAGCVQDLNVRAEMQHAEAEQKAAVEKFAYDISLKTTNLTGQVKDCNANVQNLETKFKDLTHRCQSIEAKSAEAEAAAKEVASQNQRLQQDWSTAQQGAEQRCSNLERQLLSLQKEGKSTAANVSRLQSFMERNGVNLETIASWIAQADENIKSEVVRALEMQDQKVTEKLINQAMQEWIRGSNFERRLERMKTEITGVHQHSLVLVMQNQTKMQEQDKKEKEIIRKELEANGKKIEALLQQQQQQPKPTTVESAQFVSAPRPPSHASSPAIIGFTIGGDPPSSGNPSPIIIFDEPQVADSFGRAVQINQVGIRPIGVGGGCSSSGPHVRSALGITHPKSSTPQVFWEGARLAQV